MVRTRDSVGELEIRSSADEATRGPGFLDLTGRELGRYRIQKRLGRGGVTTVYQAYDIVDDIPVALKVLLHGNDEKLYNRFRQEAQTAAKLHHPNIVRTLRVGVTPGSDTAYIAMELVEGEDLAAMLAMRRRLTPEETCLLLHPIARALAYAHEQGIVHRDVKPSNILLRTGATAVTHRTNTEVGSSEHGEMPDSVVLDALDYPVVPLLGDFGIARALDLPELTSWGRTVGTPAFMAPEQARGQRGVDHRADIYALGAVFYRCVTGRPPFSGTTVQILHAHVYDSVTISEDVQRQLSQRHVQILQRSLAKDPNDRYASALAMADDLLRGSDPTTDELTEAERESGTTLTLELISVGTQSSDTVQQNILIPADGADGQGTPSTTAKSTTTSLDRTAHPIGDEYPTDPNFDPELDQRLQRWSTMTLSVILTIFALAALFLLLRKPYQDVINLFISPEIQPTPTRLLPTEGSEITIQTAWSGVGQPMRSLGSASRDQQQLVMPTEPVISPTVASSTVTSPIKGLDFEVLPDSSSTYGADGRGDSVTTSPTLARTPTVLPPPPPTLSPTQSPMYTLLPPLPTTVAVLAQGAEPAQQITGHCTSVIDDQLREYVLTLQPPERKSFRCAMEQPIYSEGRYLDFEQGYMLYLAALDTMFVSYYGRYNEIESPWEVFEVNRLNAALEMPLTPVAPEDLQFYPTEMFAIVWQQKAVRERLGMAVTPESATATLVAQKFNQGWLILREPSGAEEAATLYTYPVVERFF